MTTHYVPMFYHTGDVIADAFGGCAGHALAAFASKADAAAETADGVDLTELEETMLLEGHEVIKAKGSVSKHAPNRSLLSFRIVIRTCDCPKFDADRTFADDGYDPTRLVPVGDCVLCDANDFKDDEKDDEETQGFTL